LLDHGPRGFWQSLLFPPLAGLSLLYHLLVVVRAALYRYGVFHCYRARVPVVAIGNLTVGGTGKTPVTDLIVKRLLAQGCRVAVVSRGYGGSFKGAVGKVADGSGELLMSPVDAGDEPCLLARRNPGLLVFVARRRALGVQAAEGAGAQVVVLDDAFQHLAVGRDLNIVLVDSRAPFGNGHLLPAGPLREPLSALRRADLLIRTHATKDSGVLPGYSGPQLACRHRLADHLLSLDGRRYSWAQLAGQKILAFAGIAHPEDFFAALTARGVTPLNTLAFADHQDYSVDVLNRLVQLCENVQLLITTEKDAVKLHTAALPCPCLAAPLELEFAGEDVLDVALERVLSGMPWHLPPHA
jgi:tetraacyldisaccharide 4'-kinase